MLWVLLFGLAASQTTTGTFTAYPTDGSTASDLSGSDLYTDAWTDVICGSGELTDTGINCGDVTIVEIADGDSGAIVVQFSVPVSSSVAFEADDFAQKLQDNLTSGDLKSHFEGTTIRLYFYQKSASQFQQFNTELLEAMAQALGISTSDIVMKPAEQSGANVYIEYIIPTSSTWTTEGSGNTMEQYLQWMSGITTLNTLTGAFVESLVMFNGESTESDLIQYQEDLRLAWAASLGVADSDVSIVEIAPSGLNAVKFGHVYSWTAAQALASSEFYDIWRNNLAQIDGLNAILGLTSTSLSVSLSDVTVSGFQLQFTMTEPREGAMVYWTVQLEDSAELASSQIIAGTGLCDGSTLQSADAYEQYVNCNLEASQDYELYMYYADGGDGSEVRTSFQTGGQLYIQYPYTFLGFSVADVQAQLSSAAAAFAAVAGVSSAYVSVSDSSDSDNGAVIQFLFPYTSWTSSVTSSSDFVTSFEFEMAKNPDLAPFVTNVVVPYDSVGDYEHATEADAQAACQARSSQYNLCTKQQLYTVVYEDVDGFSIPELCYSGWLAGGESGYYHNQAATASDTCGGNDGWQAWAPAAPGAHCCTDFTPVEVTLAVYMQHPSGYAFSSKDDAKAACENYQVGDTKPYGLCSAYQIMGIAESSDYSFNMCLGGYYEGGDSDFTAAENGFYVVEGDGCHNGLVGWHTWCDAGGCGAHCCLPSYLDDRTMPLYYGSAGDPSTLSSAKQYCAANSDFPSLCSAAQLQAVASAENTNICKAGWVQDNDDANAGEVGWYQGEISTDWCGAQGWNDGSFTDSGVAHCCKSYAKAYVSVSYDYKITPTFYADGFSSGADAQAACESAGYNGLCTKGQVIWWSQNDDPLLCRSGWYYDDELNTFDAGYHGWEGCGTVDTWHTWAPSTPVAHCCNSNVQSSSVALSPYYKGASGYIFNNMAAAAGDCDDSNGYSLCTPQQLYRVAYGDVDGYSDPNICYTGWVSDNQMGWFQFDASGCDGNNGWRTWTNGGLAGAHCCLDFEGTSIPADTGYVTATTTTTTEEPEECLWIHAQNLKDGYNGFYIKTDAMQNGKYTFNGPDGAFLFFNNEVWVIRKGPEDLVGRGVTADLFPPADGVWDFIISGSNQETYNGNTACVDSLYYISPQVSGLVSGQFVSVRLNGETVYGHPLDMTITNPAVAGTFPLAYPVGFPYEVEIVSFSSSATCVCTGCTGSVSSSTAVTISCTPKEVTVGGTVSGLSATGTIILQSTIASPQYITITSNGDWQFATSYNVGDTYRAVVMAQPTGQTCTVDNDAGVVDGIVSDVHVVCENNAYSVSVTVYGLNADGTGTAELQMGNDVITTSSNGLFTFPTLVGYDTEYNVRGTTPDGYACTLQDNFGVISANVDDVVFTCVELVGTSYTVTMEFKQTRNCVFGNSIQISEWVFMDAERHPINVDYVTTTPTDTPDTGLEGIDKLFDSNTQTKWLDYTMNPCDATILVHGITLETEPVYFNFATANDEPNRDPKEFDVTVCTLVNTVPVLCKTLNYFLEDLSEERTTFLDDDFGIVAYSIEIEVLNNNATVVVQNMDNKYGDLLTFTESGVQTFLYQIPQGSSFKVEVSEDPYGQSCTVNGVYQGTMTGDVKLKVYCIESCEAPAFMEDLLKNGYPVSLANELCVFEEEYYWSGQPLCIAAVDQAKENDTCPFGDKVCGGPLGKTYGGLDMQVELLLEVFVASEHCKADGELCYEGAFSCCGPHSHCLWSFDAANMFDDNHGFVSTCVHCDDCDGSLNECEDICVRSPNDPIYHPRCPPATECTVNNEVTEPEYFEDDLEYCMDGGSYYMNGMAVCVNDTQHVTQQDQDIALLNAFNDDFEFNTDVCSVAKSFDLLMQDHLYIAGIRVQKYQEIVDYANENCCLDDETVSGITEDWATHIAYLDSQQLSHGYGLDVTNDLRNIISQLETLKAALDQL